MFTKEYILANIIPLLNWVYINLFVAALKNSIEIMNDVLGDALKDFLHRNRKYKLWIHNKYGPKEEMFVETYFRTIKNISELELMAMKVCKGEILDIGAAAGCHSLILQQCKKNVTALDISDGAILVMKERGIKKIIQTDIFNYTEKQFDTLLFLMNGIGVAQTIEGLQRLLKALDKILKPGGQILFDSSDVRYLYNKELPQHYYGEIDYCYEYRKQLSGWFKWLYVDQTTMQQIALDNHFRFEILAEDEFDQYLGRLTRL